MRANLLPEPVVQAILQGFTCQPATGHVWRRQANGGRHPVCGPDQPFEGRNHRTSVTADGKDHLVSTARLLWILATQGEQPPGHIRFRDGNPLNLRADNLKAGTIPSLAYYLKTREPATLPSAHV